MHVSANRPSWRYVTAIASDPSPRTIGKQETSNSADHELNLGAMGLSIVICLLAFAGLPSIPISPAWDIAAAAKAASLESTVRIRKDIGHCGRASLLVPCRRARVARLA